MSQIPVIVPGYSSNYPVEGYVEFSDIENRAQIRKVKMFIWDNYDNILPLTPSCFNSFAIPN
jgi:hypothetical protein